MGDSPKAKRQKGNDAIVNNFLEWCKHGGLLVTDKVVVREPGSCHRFGMLALEQIEEGESIFKIPRNILLQPSTSSISKILVELEKATIFKRHEWQSLLICLLYEYTNPVSKWRPYLDLVPTENELNQAIFWNSEEIEFLDMIDMKEQTKKDIKKIEKQYFNEVLPFIKENPEYFDTDIHTLQLYKRLSGFVMAYSFTDNDPDEGTAEISMVPMADILNHVTENNAHLEYGDEYLTMVATKTIEKGSEVFNTYGNLDNEQLLCKYGFIENCPNSYDEVEIPFDVLRKTLQLNNDDWGKMLDRVNEEHPDLCGTTGLVFDRHGCLCSEDDFFGLFEVIHKEEDMENDRLVQQLDSPALDKVVQEVIQNPEQLRKNNIPDDEKVETVAVEEECNESDAENEESDDDTEELSKQFQPFDELICLKENWRATLSRAAEACARKISDKLRKFESKAYEGKSARRKKMVEDIVQGHLTILKQIQQLFKD